jgi:hypothetical protein
LRIGLGAGAVMAVGRAAALVRRQPGFQRWTSDGISASGSSDFGKWPSKPAARSATPPSVTGSALAARMGIARVCGSAFRLRTTP